MSYSSRRELIDCVERAALELADALKETGDPMFFAVHPEAVEMANAVFKDLDLGYRLVRREAPR